MRQKAEGESEVEIKEMDKEIKNDM